MLFGFRKTKDLLQQVALLQDELDSIKDFSVVLCKEEWENACAKVKSPSPTLNSLKTCIENKLSENKVAELQTTWSSTGIQTVAEILRSNSNNYVQLLDLLISEICRHSGANQGGIFVASDGENNNEQYLELKSAYAYGKKKFIQKRIDAGEGLLAQCFLEGVPTYLTQVPASYVKITSGLGEATPTSIILIPLNFDSFRVGVLELAYFKKLRDFEIEYLNKSAEHIASFLVREKQAENIRNILRISEEQAAALRSKEEELRQSIGEMKSMQEEVDLQNRILKDKNVEMENLMKQLKIQEEDLMQNLEEMRTIQEEMSLSQKQLQKVNDDLKTSSKEKEDLTNRLIAQESMQRQNFEEMMEINQDLCNQNDSLTKSNSELKNQLNELMKLHEDGTIENILTLKLN